MNPQDIVIYRQRYEKRLAEFGYSPASLGWGTNGRQDVRFSILSEYILVVKNASVLDVGCGFGDLFRFLQEKNWAGKYTGVDIVGRLLEVGKELFPDAKFIEGDILSLPIEQHDFVVESGIFNAKLNYEDNYEHIEETLKYMFSKAKVAVIADFMSSHVDFQKEGAWHSDPGKIISIINKMSKRFILRYDYMPFEFAVILFKDDSISNKNIFLDHKTT